jgi:CBS domain-containing protein
MKVQEIMTSNPQVCGPETSLATAAMLMWDNDCGVLPVVGEDKKVVGLVTDRDICIGAGTIRQDIAFVPVTAVITGKIFSCHPDDDIKAALKTMQEGRIRRLPVIDENGALRGVLSLNDIVLSAKSEKKADVTYADVITTFKAICGHINQPVQQKTATA